MCQGGPSARCVCGTGAAPKLARMVEPRDLQHGTLGGTSPPSMSGRAPNRCETRSPDADFGRRLFLSAWRGGRDLAVALSGPTGPETPRSVDVLDIPRSRRSRDRPMFEESPVAGAKLPGEQPSTRTAARGAEPAPQPYPMCLQAHMLFSYARSHRDGQRRRRKVHASYSHAYAPAGVESIRT